MSNYDNNFNDPVVEIQMAYCVIIYLPSGKERSIEIPQNRKLIF